MEGGRGAQEQTERMREREGGRERGLKLENFIFYRM